MGGATDDEFERATSLHAGWQLITDRARKLASSSTASTADRVASLELLGASKKLTAADLTLFQERLVPREPIEVQQAAVTALSNSGRADVPTLLLSDWKTRGPALRSHVLDTLLSRDATTIALLSELERGTLQAADFDAARRERLLGHKNSAIKSSATKLFSVSTTTTRQQVLDQFADVLKTPGDATRGRAVFEKRCSACHRLQDVGKQIGGDLNAVKDRSTPALLTAILDPNRAVEARFFSFTIQTTDGRSFSGLLTSETGNSVTLVGTDGKEQALLRADIETLVGSTKSFMPEGLEKDMLPQDLADVIAFVQGAAPAVPRKTQAGNKPELVVPQPDGSLRLLATNAEIRGPSLVFESKFQNLGYWQSADDVASWTIEITKPGKYALSMIYASQDGAADARFEIALADQKLEDTVVSTRVWENYQTAKLGSVELPAGKHRVTMRSIGKPKSALLDLKELRLTP